MSGCLRIFTAMATLIAISACGQNAKRATLEYVGRPVEAIYTTAYDLLQRQRWDQAALQFEEVQRQHPYSEWARRSMLMAAYARYRSKDYEEAITGAGAYISLFPGGKEAPYAYYLIGLSHFERVIDTRRSQKPSLDALNAFTELIRRYPTSDYARDASLKIELINNALAGHTMMIGRYYLKQKNLLAATRRFQSVVEKYPGTSQVPEALHRLVEINLSLGLDGQAQRAQTLLDYNFPNSVWTRMSTALMAQNSQPTKR